jgi:hypothetical protein
MELCTQRSILPQILFALTKCLRQHVSYAFAISSDTRTKCCFYRMLPGYCTVKNGVTMRVEKIKMTRLRVDF